MKTNLAYILNILILTIFFYIKIKIWNYFKDEYKNNKLKENYFNEFKPIKFFYITILFKNTEYEKKRNLYNLSFLLVLLAIIISFLFGIIKLY